MRGRPSSAAIRGGKSAACACIFHRSTRGQTARRCARARAGSFCIRKASARLDCTIPRLHSSREPASCSSTRSPSCTATSMWPHSICASTRDPMQGAASSPSASSAAIHWCVRDNWSAGWSGPPRGMRASRTASRPRARRCGGQRGSSSAASSAIASRSASGEGRETTAAAMIHRLSAWYSGHRSGASRSSSRASATACAVSSSER